MAKSSPVHFEVVGKGCREALTPLYTDLFGLEGLQSTRTLWVTRPGRERRIRHRRRHRPGTDGGGHVTFYVLTPDPQATLDKAVELGGRVVMPVTELPQVTIALFADPEGHVVGISKGDM